MGKNNWPQWPQWNDTAHKYLDYVIKSGRWTIRGAWKGTKCLEELFQNDYSTYYGTKYAVLTTSGTMALQLAMEVLDIGYGDEVIVPSLTWFAPVAAVLNVGALPILTDVDHMSTCISPIAIKKNITSKTKAIVVVHLHCAVADMDAIMDIAREYGLFVIEDCSQAHGAEWRNKKVGSIGDIGVFSFNQEKQLPSGEGGAIITNNFNYYSKLNRVRLDGCGFDASRQTIDEDQLVYDNQYMGKNASISEFQTAVLYSQFELLDSRNCIKNGNASLLNSILSKSNHIQVYSYDERITNVSYYEYIFFINYSEKIIDNICEELSERIGFSFHRTDAPVYRNELFNPISRRKYDFYTKNDAYLKLKEREFPGSEYAFQHIIAFPHYILLADAQSIIEMGNIILDAVKAYE